MPEELFNDFGGGNADDNNQNTDDANTHNNGENQQNNDNQADNAGSQADNSQNNKMTYEDLYKSGTDKAFNSFLDKKITQATTTAVNNALNKARRISDAQISESDRLKTMTAEEKATYYEKKYNDLEKTRTRDKEIDSLRTQTLTMLNDNGIPSEFLTIMFDFESSYSDNSAEEIKNRIDILSEFEYFQKGTFEKAVQEALKIKLKQVTPENRGGNNLNSNKTVKDLPSFI